MITALLLIAHGSRNAEANADLRQLAAELRRRGAYPIVEAAFFVREFLEGIGLTPYVKTSGGKGLHVVVPLKPKLDWKKVHAGTGEIAARIAASAPQTFVAPLPL